MVINRRDVHGCKADCIWRRGAGADGAGGGDSGAGGEGAGLMITTEATIAELPQETKNATTGMDGMGMM